MPKTDHPKYVALVGQLDHWSIPEHPDDLFCAIDKQVVEIHSEDSYPELSSRVNAVFARMAEVLATNEDLTLGTDLYVRVRDVGPVVAAARKLVELRGEFWSTPPSEGEKLNALQQAYEESHEILAEALKKVEDLQP